MRRTAQMPLPIFTEADQRARSDWLEDARVAIELLALTQETVTKQDLWRRGIAQPPHGPRAVTALFSWATRTHLLRREPAQQCWRSLVYDPNHVIA